jgi:hypothetical protein
VKAPQDRVCDESLLFIQIRIGDAKPTHLRVSMFMLLYGADEWGGEGESAA